MAEKKIFISLLIKGSFLPLAENVQAEIDGNILVVNGKKFSLKKGDKLVQVGRVNIVHQKEATIVGESVPFYA